jgi:hypothetical protein
MGEVPGRLARNRGNRLRLLMRGLRLFNYRGHFDVEKGRSITPEAAMQSARKMLLKNHATLAPMHPMARLLQTWRSCPAQMVGSTHSRRPRRSSFSISRATLGRKTVGVKSPAVQEVTRAAIRHDERPLEVEMPTVITPAFHPRAAGRGAGTNISKLTAGTRNQRSEVLITVCPACMAPLRIGASARPK